MTMGKPQVDTTIEDSVIDETFKNLVSPTEIHRLGREDITENRPGDVLVDNVTKFAARGGFSKAEGVVVEDGVKVSQDAAGRLDLEAAKELATGVEVDGTTVEIKD
jgi:D-lyxose ketol-isomerase